MNRRAFLANSGAALGVLALAPGCRTASSSRGGARDPVARDLAGYWPLSSDARDHSGNGHHGIVHGSGAMDGAFNGRDAFVEIPASASLQLGQRDFTLSAWVWTAPDTEDVLGDIVTQFDPAGRRGFNFGLKASAGGYSSHGDDRHVFFGIDDGASRPQYARYLPG